MSSTTEPSPVKKLPARGEVPERDRWDLSSLYASDEVWEADFKEWESQIPRYESFRGTLFEHAFSGAGGVRLVRARAAGVALRIARVHSRTAPLSSAPLIAYVLAVGEEVQQLQRLVWALALGAPASARGGER